MSDVEPTAWQPGGIELLDVEELYDRTVFDAMENLCPDMRSEKQAIRIAVVNIAGYLNADLRYEARPTSSELHRKKLEPLAAALARVDTALINLDHDARATLMKAATVYSAIEETSFTSQHESTFNPGPARYRDAVESIADMRRWVDRATNNLPQSKAGRPPEEAKLEAVKALGELWLERCGRPPTRTYDQATRTEKGPFLRFCELALTPVLIDQQRMSDRQLQQMPEMTDDQRKQLEKRMASLQRQARIVVQDMNET